MSTLFQQCSRGLAPRTAWSRRAALCAARARRPHLRLFASKADDRVPPRVFLDKEFAAARDPEIESLMKNQQTAPRISIAEEARTLIAGGKFGVLSTLSSRAPSEGFPAGSVVEYVADDQGRPIFSFSSLSPHTGDVQKDGRVSLTVMQDGFSSMDAARVNVKGVLAPVSKEERADVKKLFLDRHPGSYWVEFGDFSWFRMDQVVGAHVVAGFGRAGKASGEEYLAAHADPVAQFSAPVCGHMNKDHGEETLAMLKHYVGLTAQKATMLSLDRLGINLLVEKEGHTALRVRLPFPRPATDRKSIKELIVEMTKASVAAAAPAEK